MHGRGGHFKKHCIKTFLVDFALFTIVLIVALAFAFDFINGFHDSANAIATVVSTRVLSPQIAVLMAHLAIALGTMAGGWKIVRTMGKRVARLKPVHGFSAETAGGIVLIVSASLGVPVSTTHAISGSILGVGMAQRTTGVRWILARRIVWAWVLTIPASAAIASATYFALRLAISLF